MIENSYCSLKELTFVMTIERSSMVRMCRCVRNYSLLQQSGFAVALTHRESVYCFTPTNFR